MTVRSVGALLTLILAVLLLPFPRTAAASSPVELQAPEAVVPQPAQEPGLEPVDSERAQSDQDLRAELQAVFDRIPEFAEIEVSVEAGVVRLEGSVLLSESAIQAGDLARSFDGVRFVIDAIEESTSLDERLEPVWQRLQDFGVGALTKLPLLAVAFLIVMLAWFVGRIVRSVRLPSFLRSKNPFLQNLLQGLVQGVVILAGLLIALDLLDATALVGAVAGTAGLAGLAIGFAFKDIVENYLAGILLGLRQPFSKNDHVVVAGHEGKVVRLTWRDTILMTLEGNHVRVPNGQVFGSTVLNFSINPRRRFQFDLGIGSSDDLAGAQDVGLRTLAQMRSLLAEPGPRAAVVDVGDSSVSIRFRGWVDQREADLSSVRSEAIRLVKLALEEGGYSLPSPEYQVRIVGDGGGETREAQPSETPAPSRPVGEQEERDTSVDHTLDEQIQEDRLASAEEDLLNEGEPEGVEET